MVVCWILVTVAKKNNKNVQMNEWFIFSCSLKSSVSGLVGGIIGVINQQKKKIVLQLWPLIQLYCVRVW